MYCSRPGGNKLVFISANQRKACGVIDLPGNSQSGTPVMQRKVSRSWRKDHANESDRQADLKAGNLAN